MDEPDGRWGPSGFRRDVSGAVAGVAPAMLATVHVPGLSEHRIAYSWQDGAYGYTSGGGFLDIDGDGDIDVFMGRFGAEGPEACVYRNVSEPGAPRFTCVAPMPFVDFLTVAQGIDIDGDGADELIVAGAGYLRLERFVPERSTMDLLPELTGSRVCVPASVLPFDLDRDGLLDLVIGCRSGRSQRTLSASSRNYVLRQRTDGTFELMLPVPAGTAPLLTETGSTLAFGVDDVNDDGLLDLVLIYDTYSNENSRNLALDPGGVLFGCAPDADCAFERVRFARDERAWGSWMGVGRLEHEVLGPVYYVTDWGRNYAGVWRDGDRTFDVVADELGIEMPAAVAPTRAPWLFSWSVVIEDFNGDGTDDLLVTQGHMHLSASPLSNAARSTLWHMNAVDELWLQRADGVMVARGSEAGLVQPVDGDDGQFGLPTASRGAMSVDLDGDGRLEVFVLQHVGAPRIYTDARPDAARRCSVRPRSRYVPVWGYGVGVRGEGEATFRYRRMHGQMNLGAPRLVLSDGPRGEVRFASGAIVPFDCTDGSVRVELAEPEWLGLSLAEGQLTVSLDLAYFPEPVSGRAAFRNASGAVSIAPLTLTANGASIVAPAGATAVMLEFDGRWIGRWFEL